MLTDAQIRGMPDPRADRLVPAGGRTGLYLRMRATGRRTWVVRRRVDGRWSVRTLGDWPQLGARKALSQAMADTAPTTVGGVLFEDAVDEFYRAKIETKYRSAPHETLAYLTRDCRRLAKRRLDRITTRDISTLVEAKAQATPNAAAKLLAIIKKFTRWAVKVGYLTTDPAQGIRPSDCEIPKYDPRDRKLSDDELRALWAMPDVPYGRLLRFSLLTGCRIGEAMQMTAEQLEGDVWRIPVTKNGKEHVLPLPDEALALALARWPARKYVSLHSALKASGVGWRAHDLRRTAATRMRDAGVPVEHIEAVLNHSPPRLIRTYQRPDLMPAKRAALWALQNAVLGVVKS